jgi:hypothetical protein
VRCAVTTNTPTGVPLVVTLKRATPASLALIGLGRPEIPSGCRLRITCSPGPSPSTRTKKPSSTPGAAGSTTTANVALLGADEIVPAADGVADAADGAVGATDGVSVAEGTLDAVLAAEVDTAVVGRELAAGVQASARAAASIATKRADIGAHARTQAA